MHRRESKEKSSTTVHDPFVVLSFLSCDCLFYNRFRVVHIGESIMEYGLSVQAVTL